MASKIALRSIVLSFPLNPRKITPELLSDIAEINFVDFSAVYGSNMCLVRNTKTRLKLYLPNFSEGGFSTSFSVSGDMSEERLTRLINVYGLAASLKLFDFVHYLASSHLIVCISPASSLDSKQVVKSISALNDLHEFLNDVQDPIERIK